MVKDQICYFIISMYLIRKNGISFECTCT